jgi:DNA-binding response OmpR family regulator
MFNQLGRVVSIDSLSTDLWGNYGGPENQRSNIFVHISRIRVRLKALKMPFVVYTSSNYGYLLSPIRERK